MAELTVKCQGLLDTLKKNVEYVGSEEELKTKYAKGYKNLMDSIGSCLTEIIAKKMKALIFDKKYEAEVEEIFAFHSTSIKEAIRTYNAENVEAAVDDLYYDVVTIVDEGVTRRRWNADYNLQTIQK